VLLSSDSQARVVSIYRTQASIIQLIHTAIVLIMALAMTLQLGAGICFAYSSIDDNMSGLKEGLWFLVVIGSIVPYREFPPTRRHHILTHTVTWALALSSTHHLTSRVTTITMTICAYFTALPKDKDARPRKITLQEGPRGILDLVASDQIPGYIAFISVSYTLSIVTFALWFAYDRRVVRKTVQSSEMSEAGYERPLIAYSEASQ
jgi:hypothetical protein